MYSDEGATPSSCYQQQQQQDDPPGPLHHADSKDQLFSPTVRHAPIWSFADIIDDTKRKQSLSRDGSPHVTDEVFNSASHLFASMLSLLGTVLLIAQSAGDAWKIVAFSIYGSSLMFVQHCIMLLVVQKPSRLDCVCWIILPYIRLLAVHSHRCV